MNTSSTALPFNIPVSAATQAGSAADITARMDRLPATKSAWLLVLLISLGGFFEIYDLVFTGYIAPGMVKSGLLSTTTAHFFGSQGIGAFIAATFAGLFIGTFFLGFLPDRYGRRAIFTVSLLWYSIGSAIMACQTTSEGLLLWRFLTGIGVGIEIVTIDAYITEIVPQHMRGRAMSLNQAAMFMAAPTAAILSYWLVPLAPYGIDGWRWVVVLGSIGAVLVWFVRRAVPESPRWLAQKGRFAEAEAAMQRIEEKAVAEFGKPLPPPAPVIHQSQEAAASYRELFKPPYRSRFLMLVVFNFFQAIAFYGFANWVPTLLIAQGITVTKSLWYSFIIAFASPIGPLLVMTVADKIQRKWLIVGAAGAVIVFGISFSLITAAGPLTVLGICISLAGSMISVNYHAYQTELFPTRIRCRAVGFVYSSSRVGAMLSGFLIAFFLRDFGVVGVFAGITGAMLVVMLSIGLFGPKTNNVRLEELSK
jgi:MFS transporter, putative metabolite:H+ symporter